VSSTKAQLGSGLEKPPEAIQKAKAYLARELETGLDAVPHGAASEQAAPLSAKPAGQPAAPKRAAGELPDLLVEPAIKGASTLTELSSVLGDCKRCKLCEGRTNIVFGVGNPDADLLFVGEGPGQEEDEQGVPFVGRAGQLLNKIITGGMGLSRDDVYIANIIKCRPPNNRNPEPDEIVACEPFLQQQIAIVKPKVIVTLGKLATQALLRERATISKLRGNWLEYQGVPVMPTFHPAYLLRNPADKRIVWSDIQLVMDRLGLSRPTTKS
jgi:uracil-DNA glycosylase family 4